MVRFLLFVFVFALSGVENAQPLLTPAELAARASDPQLRIVDIRAARAPDRAPASAPAYDKGHIAG